MNNRREDTMCDHICRIRVRHRLLPLICILAAGRLSAADGAASSPVADPAAFEIVKAEHLTLDIPFYSERVTRHMHRANTHGERVTLYRIELANGIVGWGECPHTMPAEPLDRLRGRSAFDLMFAGRIRFGVQMALLDAVGRTLEVPVHQLIGRKVRDRVPIAWWMIDMPPEDWAAEAAESVRRGYTSAKLKARPWRDLIAQLEAIEAATPDHYRVTIDYNGFLLTADRAIAYLQPLDDRPVVEAHESPIYFGSDYPGTQRLADALRKPIVDHFREAHITADAGDGFLLEVNFGSLERTLHQNSLCAFRNKPHWLQMVGTGITAAYAAHLGAVLSHARMAAVTCHELWEHDLLTERIPVENGHMRVPEGPGLGVEIDEEAVRRYQVPADSLSPRARYRQDPPPVRIIIPDGAGGETVHEFADEDAYYQPFLRGEYPVFVPGVRLEVLDDR